MYLHCGLFYPLGPNPNVCSAVRHLHTRMFVRIRIPRNGTPLRTHENGDLCPMKWRPVQNPLTTGTLFSHHKQLNQCTLRSEQNTIRKVIHSVPCHPEESSNTIQAFFLVCNKSMPQCFMSANHMKKHIPAKKSVTYRKKGRRKTA